MKGVTAVHRTTVHYNTFQFQPLNHKLALLCFHMNLKRAASLLFDVLVCSLADSTLSTPDLYQGDGTCLFMVAY